VVIDMAAQATPQDTKKGTTGGIEDLRLSRVGKRPVELPKGVTASVANGKIDVKGPKGQLSRVIPPNVDVKVEAGKVVVKPTIG
jgi:large subunit ribosomal protein L6